MMQRNKTGAALCKRRLSLLASLGVEKTRFNRGKRKSISEEKNGELEASRKLHGIKKAVWHRKTMEEKMKDKNEIQHIQSTEVNITTCLRRKTDGKKYTGN